MTTIVVGMADCKIAASEGEELATYALGSCIGLAVYDPAARVGGLLHYMLPDSSIDPASCGDNPYKFADTGVPLLLNAIYARGGSKKRLVVLVAGAADMFDKPSGLNIERPSGLNIEKPHKLEIGNPGGLEIGKRNYQALRKLLWKAGLLIHGEAVGGNQSRTIRLEIRTGNLWLQESAGKRALLTAGAKGGNPWHTAS
jgi:chemotaxis protein CheD